MLTFSRSSFPFKVSLKAIKLYNRERRAWLLNITWFHISLLCDFSFFQGTSSTVDYDPCLTSAVSNTNILVVEGYLFELPHTIKTILQACEDARRHGALIAVTAADVSCIERFYDHFWYVFYLLVRFTQGILCFTNHVLAFFSALKIALLFSESQFPNSYGCKNFLM